MRSSPFSKDKGRTSDVTLLAFALGVIFCLFMRRLGDWRWAFFMRGPCPRRPFLSDSLAELL